MTNDNNWDGIEERRSGQERRSDQWYSNLELFERMENMSDKLSDKVDNVENKLGDKLESLQGDIRKYNNLNQKIDLTNAAAHETNEAVQGIAERLSDQILRCNQVQHIRQGRTDASKFIRTWLPLVISTILFALLIADRFGG